MNDNVRIYRYPETSELDPDDCCASLLEALDQRVSQDAEIIDNGTLLAFANSAASHWILTIAGEKVLQGEIAVADCSAWLGIVQKVHVV